VSAEVNANYLWEDGSEGYSHLIEEEGTYWLTLSFDQCIAQDTVVVATKDCDCIAFIPNAFTPDNNGMNESFFPVVNCDNLDNYRFLIFDRWGEIVFQTNQINDGWKGFYQGIVAPSGVYIYQLSYKNSGSSIIIKKTGKIMLLK
jgi:gliding motility-associated-like protein